jgi:hypothetical protein
MAPVDRHFTSGLQLPSLQCALMTYRVIDRFRLLWELRGLMEWRAL